MKFHVTITWHFSMQVDLKKCTIKSYGKSIVLERRGFHLHKHLVYTFQQRKSTKLQTTMKGEKVLSIISYVQMFDNNQLEGPRSIGMV